MGEYLEKNSFHPKKTRHKRGKKQNTINTKPLRGIPPEKCTASEFTRKGKHVISKWV